MGAALLPLLALQPFPELLDRARLRAMDAINTLRGLGLLPKFKLFLGYWQVVAGMVVVGR